MLTFHLPFLLLLSFCQQLYGLQSIPVVDAIDSLHQIGTFLAVGYRVEQIHLERGHADNITYDDSRFLVLDAGAVDLLQQFQGGTGYLKRIGSGCYKGADGRVSVLGQVFPEPIATDENGDGACSCVLTSKLVGTTAGERGYGCLEGRQVGYHLAKASAGADGLVLHHLRCIDARDAVQLHPRLYAWLMEMGADPRFALAGKLKGCGDAEVVQLAQGLSADAPYICQIEKGKSLYPFLLAVYHANATIALVFLSELVGYLGQRLGRCNAYAHGDVRP